MHWGNWGKHTKDGPRMWQIDHIIPLSKFNLSCFEEAKKAFHWTNCRPYCAKKNISEGNRR
jgi:5-methylcytosine-specific restriction endonuclease McrA